ncbi:hypothetical protein [Segatella copri]|uniref:Uncharacterized protein n=1 Tax=Segatella copri TaxID=165179 RepID=A0AA90UYF3_9BACT|nr:hypothetical protein [Segatella copri]MQN83060.1 hypothetical protein [Segatella copri]
MRKLYCLIIFVAFMSVVACKETGNKVDGLATNDSVQVADTLFADRVVQNAEQNEEKENLALGGKGDIKNRIWSPCSCLCKSSK